MIIHYFVHCQLSHVREQRPVVISITANIQLRSIIFHAKDCINLFWLTLNWISVSNSCKLLEVFRVRVQIVNDQLQLVLGHEKQGPLHLGRFTPEEPGSCNDGIFAEITYFSSDLNTTWSICEWCCFRRSFNCCSPMMNLNNIRRVAVEIPQFVCDFECYVRVTQWIFITVQIGALGVKELRKLHILETDNVMIW